MNQSRFTNNKQTHEKYQVEEYYEPKASVYKKYLEEPQQNHVK